MSVLPVCDRLGGVPLAALSLVLASCGTAPVREGPEVPADGGLAIAVRSSEPLPSDQALPALGPGRVLALRTTLANRGPRPLTGVELALVEADGSPLAAPATVAAGDLEPGAERTLEGSWIFPAEAAEVALAATYLDAGTRRRTLLPLGLPETGLVLERFGSTRGSSGGTGYDVFLVCPEQGLVDLVFAGTARRLAAASRISIVPRGGVEVEARVVSSRVSPDGRRQVRILLDAEQAGPGTADLDLVAQTPDGERSWRLRVGVAELEAIDEPGRLRFAFRLPSGARGEWDGPGDLPARAASAGLDGALACLAARLREDLPEAIAASRLQYLPPPGPADAGALRSELALGTGSAAGRALLAGRIRADLLDGIPERPSFAWELSRRARELGRLHGPRIVEAALAAWPSLDLAAARWPGGDPGLDRRELAPHFADAGARIVQDGLPARLEYDVGQLPGAESARFELVLVSSSGPCVLFSTGAARDRVGFSLSGLPGGAYHAGLVVRWPDGRFACGPSETVRLPEETGDEIFPQDLLSLSPSSAEILVEREDRLVVRVRRAAIERETLLGSPDVSFALVSSRYDEENGRTEFEARLVSRTAKTWTLSAGSTRASTACREGVEETMRFAIPGRFGQSFRRLEYELSGSPVAALGTVRAGLASGEGELGLASGDAAPLRSISPGAFERAGGRFSIVGTGGPAARLSIEAIPPELARGAILYIPPGSGLDGGSDVQRLAIPAPVQAALDAPGTVEFAAFCVEEGKPFPPPGRRLVLAPAEGSLDSFPGSVTGLLSSGAYPGLDGLSPTAVRDLSQLLVWTRVGAGAGEVEARAFAEAVGGSQAFTGIPAGDRAAAAESLLEVYRDGVFVTRLDTAVGPGRRVGGGRCTCGGKGCPLASCDCGGARALDCGCPADGGKGVCHCPDRSYCPRATVAVARCCSGTVAVSGRCGCSTSCGCAWRPLAIVCAPEVKGYKEDHPPECGGATAPGPECRGCRHEPCSCPPGPRVCAEKPGTVVGPVCATTKLVCDCPGKGKACPCLELVACGVREGPYRPCGGEVTDRAIIKKCRCSGDRGDCTCPGDETFLAGSCAEVEKPLTCCQGPVPTKCECGVPRCKGGQKCPEKDKCPNHSDTSCHRGDQPRCSTEVEHRCGPITEHGEVVEAIYQIIEVGAQLKEATKFGGSGGPLHLGDANLKPGGHPVPKPGEGLAEAGGLGADVEGVPDPFDMLVTSWTYIVSKCRYGGGEATCKAADPAACGSCSCYKSTETGFVKVSECGCGVAGKTSEFGIVSPDEALCECGEKEVQRTCRCNE